MTTREDILERLAYADALGHGPQTSALIAEAVSWADALGDEDLRFATRLALTEAYQQGNEAWKALAPFSWNLGRYQRRPEAFDDAQVRTLHWHFKWAVAVAGAGRALGYVCAPVLLQRVAARCVGEPSDVAAYAENRTALTEGLSALGYEYVEPDGAFYLWVRALEEDAQAFSDRAKEYELLIVPSDSFGVGGWVRLSYCIARDTIERSMPAFKALKESYEV